MSRWLWLLGICFGLLLERPVLAGSSPEFARQLDNWARAFLRDPAMHSPGLQIGIVTPQWRELRSWGSVSHIRQQPPQPSDIYEVASLTKPLVATLLAQQVLAGNLELDDPVVSCQPGETSAWCYQGQSLSWLELVTHHSGLPALPHNLELNLAQPIRQYRLSDLQAFLQSFQRHQPAGQGFSYSNLGYSLLGQALAQRTHTDFASLLQTHITAPLQLPDTRVYLNPEQRLRLLHGYQKRQPVPYIPDAGGLTPSGGVNASAQDLLHFLAAQLGLQATPLQAALELTQQRLGHRGAPGCQMSLGWQYFELRGWHWHSGSALGFKVFMGFDRVHQTGVVILANAQIKGFKMEPLGLQILDRLQSLESDKSP